MHVARTLLIVVAIVATAWVFADEAADSAPHVADRVAPFENLSSKRPRPAGVWQPTLLPPNDLTDPPVRYPNCPGGACVGMAAVVFGLWASPRSDETTSLDEAAARIIHTLVPEGFGKPGDDDAGGRFHNFQLPKKVIVDRRTFELTDREVLVPLATAIQKRLVPGGGDGKKTVEQVRAAFEEAKRLPHRMTTPADVRRELEKNGGRLVVVGLDFDPNLTETSAHAFILTLTESGRVFVWDPNADANANALAGGRPSTLRATRLPDGAIRSVVYDVDLPGGKRQTRSFRFLYPIVTFIAPRQLPPRPRRAS